MPTVLFRRDYRSFTGGHLKVRDYFHHVLSSVWTPSIYFTEGSVWDASNPWFEDAHYRTSCWRPDDADVLFLAGLDWAGLPVLARHHFRRPIINLIQDFRCVDKSDLLYHSLSNRAIRVCVSQELADAVSALARANGPIVTIPNGLDLEELPPPVGDRDIDVLIVGVKSPSLADTLARQLDAIRVRCLVDSVPRRQLLEAFGRCRVAVTLPERVEGFYLPALEAMAMGAQVVCPDCLGNRSFCVDGWNAFRPAYHLDAIAIAIRDALTLYDARRQEMTSAAAATVRQHTVSVERARFLELLTNVREVWSASLQPIPAV